MLAVSLIALPIAADPSWKPSPADNPSLRILGLLAVTVGLPYFLVSTTSSLLQAWYARSHDGVIPYRLFALSNFASLLALLSYPLLVEPLLPTRLQARGWRFVDVRHPAALVSRFALVHDGAQLLAASVVQAGAEVGEGCIVNTAAVVEHDVTLGGWVHVAPRALVCGDVAIGARSHIGAGAIVRQGIRLGEETVVGAGAVVVRDFAGGGLLIGVPAYPVEHDL